MRDEDKPREQLFTELRELRGRVAELETEREERRRVEEVLRESEERYRGVVQNTTAVILRLDPRGIIRFANDRALEVFGYSADELIGRHAVGTIVPLKETTGRNLAAMVDQIAANPDHFHSNANENLRKNGERVWMEWTNSGIYDAEGKLREFQSVGIDVTDLKRAKESEERLRALMDHSPSLVFLKDEDGRYVYLNEAYQRDFVFLKDWYGKTDFDFWPKQSAELFRANDSDVLKTGQARQFLEDSTDLYGTRFCWLCYRFPFIDSRNRRYVGGISINATGRVLAEEALREREAELAEAQRLTRTGSWSLDINRGEFRMSDELYRIMEIEKSESGSEQESFLNRIHPEDSSAVLQVHARAMTQGVPFDTEYRVLTPEGGLKIIREVGYASSDAEGWFVRLFATDQDITDRRRIEEELRRSRAELEERVKERTVELARTLSSLADSEHRFREVLENSPDVAYRFNLQSDRYDYVSPVVASISGYTSEEMLAMGIEQVLNLIHPDDLPPVIRHVEESLTGEGEKCLLEYRFRHKDGSYRWFSDLIVIVPDADGTPRYRVGTVRDITDRKQVDEDLRAYSKKLELINQELQEFAFVASHDLQEPLRKIQTFGHILSTRFQETIGADGQNCLARMTSAAKKMSDLLDSLLEYSRIASRPEPFEAVDLATLALDAVSDLEELIRSTECTIQVGEVPVIKASPRQMRQVLQNLISNAIRYSREAEKPVVRIHGCMSCGMCEIVVEDNGIGFEEQYLDRIFKPFQQLHGNSAGYGGTGMGLAICRKIIEHHGGSITARSVPGQGSTFIITLPAQQQG